MLKPSKSLILSEDLPKEKRISARRLRIVKRAEAEEKGESFVPILELYEPSYERTAKDQELKDKKKKELEEGEQRLHIIYLEGLESVSQPLTNFIQAESQEREEKQQDAAERRRQKEESVRLAQEEFQRLKEKWESKAEAPQLELLQLMQEIEKSLQEILVEKDKKIAESKEVLKRRNEMYELKLKALRDDVTDIARNADIVLAKLYSLCTEENRTLMEKALEEIAEMTVNNSLAWNKAIEEHLQRGVVMWKELEDEEPKQAFALQTLEIVCNEEINELQRQLDDHVHKLNREARYMTAQYLLTEQKLEHNIQVLEQRGSERIVIKSVYKRRLNMLRDQENALLNQCRAIQTESELEHKRLIKECERLQNSVINIARSAREHFKAVDRMNFNDVWLLREEEAKECVKKMFDSDKVFHSQILGREWEPVDVSFMSNRRLFMIKEEMSKSRSKSIVDGKHWEWPDNICCLLEIICDEMGFVIEERLEKMLEPYLEEQCSLLTVDIVLRSTGITSKEYLKKLTQCLLKYVETEDEDGEHRILSPQNVLKAFQEFVDELRSKIKLPPKLDLIVSTDPGCEFTDEDAAYWARYLTLFPVPRQRLWEAIYEIQKKYYRILKRRAVFMDKKTRIIQQNKDFETALKKCYSNIY